MSRDQRIDQSATSYSVCKFKTSVHGATFLRTSHLRSALLSNWISATQCSDASWLVKKRSSISVFFPTQSFSLFILLYYFWTSVFIGNAVGWVKKRKKRLHTDWSNKSLILQIYLIYPVHTAHYYNRLSEIGRGSHFWKGKLRNFKIEILFWIFSRKNHI